MEFGYERVSFFGVVITTVISAKNVQLLEFDKKLFGLCFSVKKK